MNDTTDTRPLRPFTVAVGITVEVEAADEADARTGTEEWLDATLATPVGFGGKSRAFVHVESKAIEVETVASEGG